MGRFCWLNGLRSRCVVAGCAWFIITTAAAFADTGSFAPPNIVHILQLQGTGIIDSAYSAEPCTTAGMADANKRANDSVENRDAVTLYIQQHGFAIGFAHCALSANTKGNFLVFAAAYAMAATYSLIGARGSNGRFFQIDHARARQAYTICAWLLKEQEASVVDKINARHSIQALRALRVL
jgi:hypothetical protein